MAARPGLLTEWPWQWMGNFKYLLFAPWVVDGVRKAAAGDVDVAYMLIFPLMLARMLHNQVWISLSRYQNARSKHRILDRGIEFDQVDRERNWDDQIIFNGLLYYLAYMLFPEARHLPMWRSSGIVVVAVLHAGPVEFLYYWLHRALHHHFLYSRYHSHHHASIVTEPITSVIHPFAEHISYFTLFAIPMLASLFSGTCSVGALALYIFYIDLMNNMGHCNFELVPRSLFRAFPPLKYIMYTPSYHSLHHTQFRTNYSLFMPFYDHLYGTADASSETLYETSLRGRPEAARRADVVHLTHPAAVSSAAHLRLGFAAFASRPYASAAALYAVMTWPLAWLSVALTWLCTSSFALERNQLGKLRLQVWAVPRYGFQYGLSWEKERIREIIEKSVVEAEVAGARVLTLGMLNQSDELNCGGELYIQKFPKMKLRIVDGTRLAAAAVLDSIPAGARQVLLMGSPMKLATTIAGAACEKGLQVLMPRKHEFELVKPRISATSASNLITLARNINQSPPQVWIVGDGFGDEEHRYSAAKNTIFIPFSQTPPKKLRKDCTYFTTPAMKVPDSLENLHSCENWLPRRAMSAWRAAGIVHAMEGWENHECGDQDAGLEEVEKVWKAALAHGFLPLAHRP